MKEQIMEWATDMASSPWFYLAIFAIAIIDSFFPIVPSETLVITGGVFAASGITSIWFVIPAAALGAFIGDHISYFIGRFAGERLSGPPGSKRRKAFDWAHKTLEERGGLVLVVARYVPGGRTAATMTLGAVGYPLRSFAFFDAIAAVSWAIYSAMIGYIGGKAFEEDPFKGLIVGLGLALTITGIVELIRWLRHRRRRTQPTSAAEPEPAADHSGR